MELVGIPLPPLCTTTFPDLIVLVDIMEDGKLHLKPPLYGLKHTAK